jgi:hypothetical protein
MHNKLFKKDKHRTSTLSKRTTNRSYGNGRTKFCIFLCFFWFAQNNAFSLHFHDLFINIVCTMQFCNSINRPFITYLHFFLIKKAEIDEFLDKTTNLVISNSLLVLEHVLSACSALSYGDYRLISDCYKNGIVIENVFVVTKIEYLAMVLFLVVSSICMLFALQGKN